MSTVIPLGCSGQHLTSTTLALLTVPDGDTSVDVDGHRHGLMCGDCGVAYQHLVSQGKLPRGVPPTAAQVDGCCGGRHPRKLPK